MATFGHGMLAGEHGTHHAGPHGVVRQREIVILDELDDIYLIEDGLAPTDKIILEGVSQVRDGQDVEYEYRSGDEVFDHLKYKAE